MDVKFKWLWILMVSLFVFPLNARAKCDYQRLADLSKIASNVNLDYSYDLDESGYPIFTVYISNITPDIYVVDGFSNTYTFNSNEPIKTYGGLTLNYDIYSGDPSCFGERITKKYVNLQAFNQFYYYDECKSDPEFKYCKLWMDNNFSVDYFKKSYAEYKAQNEKMTSLDDEFSILDYWYVGVIIAVIIVIVVVALRRYKL